MKKYKLFFGPNLVDVQEYLRDVQVIYENDKPKEIQIWVGKNYSMNGFPLKTEAPLCTVVKLKSPDADLPDAGDQPFGSLGVSLAQALTVLGVFSVASGGLPEGASDVVQPETPAGIGAALEELKRTIGDLTAKETELHESISASTANLSSLSTMIASAEEELEVKRDSVEGLAAAAKQDEIAHQTRLDELDALIAAKEETVKVLDASIVAKSEESTALALVIEEMNKALNK